MLLHKKILRAIRPIMAWLTSNGSRKPAHTRSLMKQVGFYSKPQASPRLSSDPGAHGYAEHKGKEGCNWQKEIQYLEEGHVTCASFLFLIQRCNRGLHLKKRRGRKRECRIQWSSYLPTEVRIYPSRKCRYVFHNDHIRALLYAGKPNWRLLHNIFPQQTPLQPEEPLIGLI